MTESKHTPGPWRIESRIYQMGRKLSGHVIAHGINGHGDGPEGYICKTEWSSEEDARLIAAAPDLLEALKAIVAAEDAALAEWPKLSMRPWTGDEPAMKRLAAARAAIAKAEGRRD